VERRSLDRDLSEFAQKWGWSVALGIGLLIAGGFASTTLISATLASILYIGAMMLVGGVLQLLHACTADGRQHRLLLVAGGVLYAIAGGISIYDPVMASVGISLAVGVLLMRPAPFGSHLRWRAAVTMGGDGWQPAAC